MKPERLFWPLILTSALVVLTACTDTQQTEQSAPEENSATEQCIERATQHVEETRKEVPLVLPEPSFKLSEVSGKNIWVVNVVTNQYIIDSNEGHEAAAEAAGVKLTVFDGQGNVNTWNEGIQQAIAQEADGILLYGIHSALVSEAVKEAVDKGITVVESMGVNYDAEVAEGIFTNTSGNYDEHGDAAAAWILADSQCEAHTYLLYSSGLPIWLNVRDGALATYEEYCPDCQISSDEAELANIATELPRLTQTKLSQEPNINYVLATWDAAIPFIGSAASQVNPEVKLVARDGIDEALEEIRAGGMQKATVASAPPQWIAWVAFDNVLRGIAGEDPNEIVIPIRLVDNSNIGANNDDVMAKYIGFEEEFAKVWN